MGLDVTAYKIATLATDQTMDRGDDQRRVWADPEWSTRIDGLTPGLYDVSGEEAHLPSQPYSTYNRWRERLCWGALGVSPEEVWRSYEEFSGRPFVELIHFTDCDGVLGPVTSEKLLKDFVDHLPQFELALPWYAQWTHIFAVAAHTGIVVFH